MTPVSTGRSDGKVSFGPLPKEKYCIIFTPEMFFARMSQNRVTHNIMNLGQDYTVGVQGAPCISSRGMSTPSLPNVDFITV